MKTVFPPPVPPPLRPYTEYHGGWCVATNEVAACCYDTKTYQVKIVLRSGYIIAIDCVDLAIARRTLSPIVREMAEVNFRLAT